MRTRTWTAALLLAALAAAGCAGTSEQSSVAELPWNRGPAQASWFYDDLAPYGSWVDYGPYGSVWSPYDVGEGWCPYRDGTWAYGDYGWTWLSSEPWAADTYHYGRWFYDPRLGWLWVPGDEWAPAWVAWRASDDWVGWAPLPPSSGWNPRSGVGAVDVHRIPQTGWSFVPRAAVLEPDVASRIVTPAQNPGLLTVTRDATRYQSRQGRAVNLGLDVGALERSSGRPAPRLSADEMRSLLARPSTARPRPGNTAAAPVPPPLPAGAMSDAAQPRRYAAERAALERSLQLRSEDLARRHAREVQEAGGTDADGVRARQAAEDRAMQERAAHEREAFERRWKGRMAPGRGRGPDGDGH